MPPYPEWLHVLSWTYLSFCCLCAEIIIVDELRRPQKIEIMNFVWPITALYFGPVALWGYFRSGLKRPPAKSVCNRRQERDPQGEP